jgi:hypothetical protein
LVYNKFEIFKLLLDHGSKYDLENIKEKYEIDDMEKYIKYIEDFEKKTK